jgi:hypothetical protein
MTMKSQEPEEEFTFWGGLQELGERIRKADGVVPLKPGEIRPPGFYLVNHYLGRGRKPLPPPKNQAKS